MFKSQESHGEIGTWQSRTRKQLGKKKKKTQQKKKKIDKDDDNTCFKKKDLNVKRLRENRGSTQMFFF